MNKQDRILPGMSEELLLAAFYERPVTVDDQKWRVISWQRKSYGNRFELLHSDAHDHMIIETNFSSDRVTTYTIERS